jgi:hypothetical protein
MAPKIQQQKELCKKDHKTTPKHFTTKPQLKTNNKYPQITQQQQPARYSNQVKPRSRADTMALAMITREGTVLTTKQKQLEEMRAIKNRGLGDARDKAFAIEYFRRQRPLCKAPTEIKIAQDDGQYSTVCFWTRRGDADFESEWLTIPNQKMLLGRAMRLEIRPQIDAFRFPHTGNEFDVDHKAPTFRQLMSNFIQNENGGKDPTFVVDKLEDRALAARWYAYHDKYKVLQKLTRKEHKAKTKADWEQGHNSGRDSKRRKTGESDGVKDKLGSNVVVDLT